MRCAYLCRWWMQQSVRWGHPEQSAILLFMRNYTYNHTICVIKIKVQVQFLMESCLSQSQIFHSRQCSIATKKWPTVVRRYLFAAEEKSWPKITHHRALHPSNTSLSCELLLYRYSTIVQWKWIQDRYILRKNSVFLIPRNEKKKETFHVPHRKIFFIISLRIVSRRLLSSFQMQNLIPIYCNLRHQSNNGNSFHI